MSTYLYCVLAPPDADALPLGLRGIGDASVRSLVSGAMGPLEAWVASIGPGVLRVRGRALAEQALTHNEVVNAALRTGRTPLPARFGSRFESDAACIADLADRAGALRQALARVAGAVEMSVLIAPSGAPLARVEKPSSTEAAAGRRYLESIRTRALAAERWRAEADGEAERIASEVRHLIRAEARTFASSGVLSVAHLVGRAQLDRYQAALAALTRGSSFRVLLGEARAPYSFAAPNDGSGGHDSGNPDQNE